MRAAFDRDQEDFAGQFRSFCEKECPPSAVRAAWTSEVGFSRERWGKLAELGVLGIGVPEELGGIGRGEVELAALLEVAGWAAVPEPVLETMAMAVPLLRECASGPGARVAREWLALIAAGEAVVTVGPEPAWASGATGSQLTTVLPGADMVLVAGSNGVVAVPSEACGIVARRALDGTRRLAEVTFDPAAATVLAGPDEALASLGKLADQAACGSAALLVGLSSRLLGMAVEHAGERRQFGRQIGSFQAVKHKLSDVALRIELARPAVWYAAWQLANQGAEASQAASVAKALAAEAATAAASASLQVHGAIGYTAEHDLHLWMKRSWALASWWGDAAHHRSRVLQSLIARTE